MDVRDFWRSVPEAARWPFSDQIKLLAWFRKTYLSAEYFSAKDISNLYDSIGAAQPSAVGPILKSLADKKVPDLLVKGGVYRLEAKVVAALDAKYGQRLATLELHKLLKDLPNKLPAGAEKTYLEEAIKCLQISAYRAAVVMAWNLTYDHLCHWVLNHHLVAFNTRLPIRFPKKGYPDIKKREDFTDMQESDVVEVCNSASLFTGSIHKVLKEKLDRRNVAAHPSGVGVNQLFAEAYVTDIVENVVLKLC